MFAFHVGAPNQSLVRSYTWVLTCHLCKQPDGTLKAQVSADSNADDVAAILRITLRSRSDGVLMTVGRSRTADEQIVRTAPGQGALSTTGLRPAIASALSASIRPPDSEATLTPEAEAEFRRLISLYSSGVTVQVSARIPPLGDWLFLFAAVLSGGVMTYLVVNRIRLSSYLARGHDRLNRNLCPDCGYELSGAEHPLKCPECGTVLAKWTERAAAWSRKTIAINTTPPASPSTTESDLSSGPSSAETPSSRVPH